MSSPGILRSPTRGIRPRSSSPTPHQPASPTPRALAITRRAAALVGRQCSRLALVASARSALAPGALRREAATARQGQEDDAATRSAAVGYGSRVRGGQIPAASGTTAYQSHRLHQPGRHPTRRTRSRSVDLPGLGRRPGRLRRRTWTTAGRRRRPATSPPTTSPTSAPRGAGRARAHDQGGSARCRRASHDATGFHATTEVERRRHHLPRRDGTPQRPATPDREPAGRDPGRALKISIGEREAPATPARRARGGRRPHRAAHPDRHQGPARAHGARLGTGVKHGLFFGSAVGHRDPALDDPVHERAQPLLKMPVPRHQAARSTARARRRGSDPRRPRGHGGRRPPVRDPVDEQAPPASTRRRSPTSTWATASWSAHRDLGPGQRHPHPERPVKADTDGTTIGSRCVNGQSIALPDLDGFTIPGLVKIDTKSSPRGPRTASRWSRSG